MTTTSHNKIISNGLFVIAFMTLQFFSQSANAQCAFTGLDSVYCVTDAPATMVGVDATGTFEGPGVTGDQFDPSEAGIGTHMIYHTTAGGGGTGDAYYIKSNLGNPWGSTTNNNCMDNAFGVGGWTLEAFETVDVAAVFGPATGFVFMDGSDGQATELNTFLIANLPAIEDWVNDGGRLIINSAPNEGDDMDFGFDGTTLVYDGFASLTPDVVGVDATHPVFLGPMLPTTTSMSGNWYAHAYITGTGYTNLLVDEADASNVILTEKCWGSGKVMMGGMTTYNWHTPAPQVEHFRSNLMSYMYDTGCGVDCIDSFEVVVVASPTVIVEDIGEQCLPVEIADIVLTLDDAGTGDCITGWYTVEPDSIGDPADTWPGGPVGPGDVLFVAYGSPSSGCYDVKPIEILFTEAEAGNDSTMIVCNSGAGGIVNVNDMLFGADPGGTWQDVSDVPTAGFNAATGLFDPTGVPAGVYEFIYITSEPDPCPNDTASMVFTVVYQVLAGADNAGQICNQAGFTYDLNTLLSGHDAGGFWQEITPTAGAFNEATGIFAMDGTLTAGDYDFRYVVLGFDPCINDTSNFTITVSALPNIDAGSDQEICDGEETLVDVDIIGGIGGTPVWDPVGIADGVPFTPEVGTLTYTVTVTDALGCVSSDRLDITVHPLPDISFTASEVSGCTPFQTVFTIESSEVVASTTWSFGDGDIATGVTSPTIEHIYLDGGLFTVSAEVTDINGCVNSITYTDYITVEKMPEADFDADPQSVFTNDTEVRFTNGSLYETEYEWDFGDGSDISTEENPTHFFPQDQGERYYPVELTVSNYLGCKDSMTMYIHVKDIILFHVPNAFTPDGDNFNETFQPVFESGFDPYDFHMVVFNRWGEIVFETYDATKGWNGTYGSRGIVEDGVYIWSIDFKEAHSDKRHTVTGHVSVIQ